LSIFALLHDNFDVVAVLIDRAPQVPTLALDADDHLVKEPAITSRALAFCDTLRVLGSERVTRLPNGVCDAVGRKVGFRDIRES
jgi:hypothetical protein